MLFSSDDIANFINDTFEPAWESLGPVPKVTVDFGNGRTVTRTLNGNVATYACTADGTVLDILPGIYAPAEYRRQLEQLFLLAQYVEGRGGPAARLKAYHQRQADTLARYKTPATLILDPGGGFSILGNEGPVRLIVAGRTPAARKVDPVGTVGGSRAVAAAPGWRELALDTEYNETTRRRLVHARLAELGPVKPADVVKWLYKEVLHTDLDDPTLGLSELLNRREPFTADGPPSGR